MWHTPEDAKASEERPCRVVAADDHILLQGQICVTDKPYLYYLSCLQTQPAEDEQDKHRHANKDWCRNFETLATRLQSGTMHVCMFHVATCSVLSHRSFIQFTRR